MKITDLFFKQNNLESFIYVFKFDCYEYSEVIYGFVSEILEKDFEENPKIVMISQIINLEDFLNKKEFNTINRTFKVSDLAPNPQFRTNKNY